MTAISAFILVPCFWHREIEAADLGSHLYNAWLVELIHGGSVHGLWIEHRWNNVLFDYLLSGFGAAFGLHAAEKIAVSLAVLTFFWGAFALASAASRRATWYLLPLIAIAGYGWTFQIGLFNYYLALGLSFFALGILWRGRSAEWILALGLAPLIMLAHPLALFWLAGTAAYVFTAERIPRIWHLGLPLAGVAALFGVHEYLWTHYVVESHPHNIWFFNGADQLVLFSDRYQLIAYGFLAFIAVAVISDAIPGRQQVRQGNSLSRGGAPSKLWEPAGGVRLPNRYATTFELYLLVFAAVILLPRGAQIPGHTGALALLTDRLTSVSVVLLICLAAEARPRKWHLVAGAGLAAVFFSFVYQDSGRLNRMEAEVARLVRTLPPGRRVMGTILPPADSRVTIQHILDRACIGYCYSYSNYEPGSKMFRVRAVPGNPYVVANYNLAIEMERGTYVVRLSDLPVWEVYECGPTGVAISSVNLSDARFCMVAVRAGEPNMPNGAR